MKSLRCPLLLGRFVGLLAWDLLAAGEGCFALPCSGIFHLRGKCWQADAFEGFKSLRLNLPGGQSRASPSQMLGYMFVWFQTVSSCRSLMLAVQVTGRLPGKNSLVRNRQSHHVCNTGSGAGAHLAPVKADSMVLVTRGDQEEKPGGHGVTDGVVRRRSVWRE